MYAGDTQIAIIVGIVLSLIYAEKTGVLPAGLIVPGYLAMYFDQPVYILVVIFLSVLVYTVVRWGIGQVTILYGRRLFAAMLITAAICRFLLEMAYPLIPFEIFSLQSVGVIVPGLIANSIHKQGLTVTLGGTVLISGLTFLIMLVYPLFLR